MLITLYKIGGVQFCLLGTNGFHVKAKKERFTAASFRCYQNQSNMKILRRCLADYVKTLHQKACRTCSTIIFLHSTKQIIDLWHCRWRCRRQISLLFRRETRPSKIHVWAQDSKNTRVPLSLTRRVNFARAFITCLLYTSPSPRDA